MGRAGSCSGGQVMLHKTCLLMGLCSLPDGCLALGNPALEPTDYSGVNDSLRGGSHQ